jgi:hypothetical protein
MRGMSRCLSVALLVGVTGFWSNGFSKDKDKKEPPAEKQPDPEKARFLTADTVQLFGTFYPSMKKNPPTVILLHNIGEDRKKKAWVTLAQELQKKGFAVLTFDFRGHGESTGFDDANTFWKMNNQNYFKRGVWGKAAAIDQAQFNPSYYQILCNDIAAARAYLERTKADNGEANTSNLIVIGADTSATLGAIWINSEFSRHRFKPSFEGGPPNIPETRSEGENSIVAAVWLGMSSTLEKQPVNLASVLNTSARIKGVAMSFWYGKEDAVGLKAAHKLLDNSIFMYKKGKKEKEDKYEFTTVVEVPSTKLTGSELLLKGKGVALSIGEYLERVLDSRSNDRSDYRFADSVYKWKQPNGQFPPFGGYTNMKGDKTLMWNTYSFWR